MRSTTRRWLALHAALTAGSTALAIARGLPAAPFGIATRRTAAFDALIGYGTAVSAPWPVAAGMWTLGPRMLTMAAPALAIGQLSEPLVWHRATWRDPVLAATIAMNLTLPIAIALSARNDLGTFAP